MNINTTDLKELFDVGNMPSPSLIIVGIQEMISLNAKNVVNTN